MPLLMTHLLFFVVKIVLVFLVYQDMTRYLPLPNLTFAQFVGVWVFVVMVGVAFFVSYADLQAYQRLTKSQKSNYGLASVLMTALLAVVYCFVAREFV